MSLEQFLHRKVNELLINLKSKHIKVQEIHGKGSYLRSKWEKTFANHLNDSEKVKIYLNSIGGFLWHLFSFKKVSFLQGEEADLVFNNEPKGTCYIFYQHIDLVLLIENAAHICADDFKDEQDVYIVDEHFSWTYVVTHEKGELGPYFSRKE
ncbi:DUF4275 family protein [Cytobacillus sp. IB215316]|uniref:DUF4275 family protein n=1 Tax=Cytobacillus sp. IB215316 TaxID=3097354 RepID=UPI002A122663|nr:DUF4275 family protein [Cytobacillus sp. IB215316]MDX8362806.1 DUF4275 family protein [Cytobacillus sp. IB215316]